MEVDCGDLIGAKYRLRGRGDGYYDCYGLVLEVEKRYGHVLPDYDYMEPGVLAELSARVIASGKAKKIDEPVPGAIVMFSNVRAINSHIGVYVGDGMFIHCTMAGGVRLERLGARRNSISGAYVWLD